MTHNEKTPRRVLGSTHAQEAEEQTPNMPLHGVVVPPPKRKQTKRAKRAPSRVQRVKSIDVAKETTRLRKRVDALLNKSLKLTQIAPVVGLSYTGLYRMTISGDIKPDPTKIAEYHKRLDVWCKQLGAI